MCEKKSIPKSARQFNVARPIHSLNRFNEMEMHFWFRWNFYFRMSRKKGKTFMSWLNAFDAVIQIFHLSSFVSRQPVFIFYCEYPSATNETKLCFLFFRFFFVFHRCFGYSSLSLLSNISFGSFDRLYFSAINIDGRHQFRAKLSMKRALARLHVQANESEITIKQ